MKPAGGYETVEHTADLALRVWAPDLRGLIEQAARGMLDLMLDEHPAAAERREVVASGPDAEEMLVDSLREVLALLNIRGAIPVSIDAVQVEADRVRLVVGATQFDTGRHALVQEIKAVTYHGLEVVQTEEGLAVTVVFDV